MTKYRWLRYLILFWLGVLAGGAVLLFRYGHELEKQMFDNHNLRLLNEKLWEELDSLKQSQKIVQKQSETVIHEVRVTIWEPFPDALTSTEVVRRLEKDMAPLIGKKVEQVAEFHPLLHELLRHREYVVEGKKVEIQLKTVVISRILQLFVTVRTSSGPFN